MSLNTIINRYVFWEMLPPFLISLLFIIFVFLMAIILKITKLIVNYRVSLWKVILFVVYAIPYRLEFVIPMAVMMAILLTFLRMSSDNEIMALKASGMSLYRLLPPAFLFCLIGALLTAFMTIFGSPWGKTAFRSLTFEVAQAHLDAGLKERKFNDTFKNVMLYVSKIDLKRNSLIDVFIEDQRDARGVSTVVAPRGRLLNEEDSSIYHLQLYNGIINQVNLKDKTTHTVRFDTYDIRLDIKKAFAGASSRTKDEEEMSIPELMRHIDSVPQEGNAYYIALMEFHKKFSLPVACFVLGLLAVPLGIQSRGAKRSFGIALGLILFMLYYVLLSAAWVFGEVGLYPPLIGMWMPNLIMGGIGLCLIIWTAKERALPIAAGLHFLKRISAKFGVPVR